MRTRRQRHSTEHRDTIETADQINTATGAKVNDKNQSLIDLETAGKCFDSSTTSRGALPF
jgi:hypothetical protein